MKHFLKTSFLIIFSIFCGLFCFSEPTFATSLNVSVSSTQVAPGATFTVTVSSDGTGRVNLAVSGGKVLGDSFVWVEENRIAGTASITAGTSGTVTITATPVVGFSDPDGNEANPSPRTISVKIVTPTPAAPTTPTAPTTTPSTPSNSSNSSKPSATTPKPTTPAPTQNNPSNSQTTNGATENTPEEKDSETTEETVEEIVTEAPNEPETQPAEALCAEPKRSLAFAWTIAIIFALLFFITLAILIYFILKSRKTPESAPTDKHPKDNSTKTKSKASSSKKSKKSKTPKAENS